MKIYIPGESGDLHEAQEVSGEEAEAFVRGKEVVGPFQTLEDVMAYIRSMEQGGN